MQRTVLVDKHGCVVNVILADETFVSEHTPIVSDIGGIGQLYESETGLFIDVVEPLVQPDDQASDSVDVASDSESDSLIDADLETEG